MRRDGALPADWTGDPGYGGCVGQAELLRVPFPLSLGGSGCDNPTVRPIAAILMLLCSEDAGGRLAIVPEGFGEGE